MVHLKKSQCRKITSDMRTGAKAGLAIEEIMDKAKSGDVAGWYGLDYWVLPCLGTP